MRRALEEFRDNAVEDGAGEDVDGDGMGTERQAEALEQRVRALEEERRGLQETVEGHGNRVEELESRVAALEARERPKPEAEQDGVGDGEGPRRSLRQGSGPANAGVVTLEKQPDEDDAFGSAAALVAEWRELRSGAASARTRVDRAKASLRRWEVEIVLLRDFRLTLPPETQPLGQTRREDHLRWPREALAEAKRELHAAVNSRWLRRAVTFDLWWR